ncbi:hypothetical protein H0H93_000993 [Arthromyces matolae]|nr:hypothetical protein H0H93_000993 [Arthromyces matolae]
MHGNDPETLEKEKVRNLADQQHLTSSPHKNAPGWNETLASESEATVKADRSESASTVELQEQTVEYVRSRYSPDDRRGPTTAEYSRDEVSGPLSQARGHEDSKDGDQTTVKSKKTRVVVEDDSVKGYA